jgi:hypothetical protein
LGPRNSPGCGPPRWWAADGGERCGERRPVAVAPSSWLGEVRGAQAVLTVASARRFHGRRCRSVWKRSRRRRRCEGEPRRRAGREEAKQRCFSVTVAARVRAHSAATAAPAHAWAETRGYGPTCATGKRAPSLILFPKFQNQHKFCNSIW